MPKDDTIGMTKWEAWAESHTDPADVRRKDEALDGTIAPDLSYGNFAGLFCSSTLGEFGAKVIRVEPPGGDVARKFSPFGAKVRDTGFACIAEGRNKYHVAIDLHKEKGRDLFLELVVKSDVVVENMRRVDDPVDGDDVPLFSVPEPDPGRSSSFP